MEKYSGNYEPLLTKPAIRGLISTLQKKKTELTPYLGALTENAEQCYIDKVTERLGKCQSLRKESYITLLKDVFYEKVGEAIHSEDRKKITQYLDDFTLETSFPNYAAFLQEHDLAFVIPPNDTMSIKNLPEFSKNKERIDDGFLNFMRREKGAESIHSAKHEIDLFALNLEINAITMLGEKMASSFERDTKQNLGSMRFY